MPSVIEICPAVEWIVTTADIAEVETYLESAHLELWKEFELSYSDKPPPTPKIKIGTYKFNAFKGLGAAAQTLAAVAILAQVIEAVETYEPVSTRRKRRTWLCVSTCLGIIAAAREDVGIMENRALLTEKSERRTRRKFPSHA